MEKKLTKRGIAIVTMALMIVNLILPMTSYAEIQNNSDNFTKTLLVNNEQVNLESTVKLKPGDNIEYRLDYKINNNHTPLKEGDIIEFNLPNIFSDVKIQYPQNHFKDMQQNRNHIYLICNSNIVNGYLTVSAVANQVDNKAVGQIVTNIAGKKEVINAVVKKQNIFESLVDNIVNNNNDAKQEDTDKEEAVEEEIEAEQVNTEEELLQLVKSNSEENEEESPKTDEKVKGSLEITNMDESDKLLEGSEFTVINKEGQIVEAKKTDANGVVLFKDLEVGKYTYVQTKAPEGYKLNEEKKEFEIISQEQVVRVDVINKKSSESGTTNKPTTNSGGSNNVATGDIGLVGYGVTLLASVGVLIGINKKKETK